MEKIKEVIYDGHWSSLTFEVVGDKLLVLTKGNSDSVIGYEIVGLDGKRHILDDENQPTIKGNEF